ncbi:4-hydroxybutyrate coenzyme A transferase [Cutibacterium acnes JCM 18918]|nr:4-hydroxybutyrate coenzyme A transferase [Cutibacterium acnes JCM 18918]
MVITEQGIADLFGKSQEEQARQLIDNAAHPNAREKNSGARPKSYPWSDLWPSRDRDAGT